jgi:perosamine synthetase
MKFIPIANPQISEVEAKAVYKVVKKGWISMGKNVQNLEEKIEKFLNVKNAILFNNGTSSLHAALLAYDVKLGDEVIVPTLSYISSANVVLYCGAKPIFCDSDEMTFNTDAEKIISKITKKTKAIITTDLKGMPVDFFDIKKKLKKYNIPLISDSAESFGADYKNDKVGKQFDIHSFSFFANKNITMGEGGLITCQNSSLAKKIRIIRNQGQNRRYNHILLGNNFRPTDYAAAIGIEQLKKIDKVINEKNKIADYYNKFLDRNNIDIPFIPKYVTRHSWYMYCIKLKKTSLRNKFLKYLHKNKIDTRLSFPPIHLQPLYKKKFSLKSNIFPSSKRAFDAFVDIPCWFGMKQSQIKYIVNKINNFFK